jgi:hypothetical protein
MLVRMANLWLFVAAALWVLSAAPLRAQNNRPRTNPGKACGVQSKGLPDFYHEAVLALIKPPNWEGSLFRIMIVSGERKLALWTDGEAFKLWTETPDIPKKNIDDFLFRLDEKCVLPADPREAVALLRIKWQSVDLSAAQFAKIHADFVNALSQFVSSVGGRYDETMKSKGRVFYLHTVVYRVAYYNDRDYDPIEISVWNDPDLHEPMLAWIHQLQKLGEDSFHHPILWPQPAR